MNQTFIRALVLAIIALSIGVAGTAVVLASIPDSGSSPAIFDDFKWSSTANGFWHVNAIGASATIKNSLLTLSGDSVELDRRIQTDPNETVVAAKIRAQSFDKFGIGLGIYHAGTIGMEFDADGAKCGRGTDHGYWVDPVTVWKSPPVNQWLYVYMVIVNPYPDPKVLAKLGNLDYSQLKKVKLICAVYDASGKQLGFDRAKNPPPNAHYAALDEAYVRTWDSRNHYQLDWFYAGPPSGDPLNSIVRKLPL